jgi:hypothetical protein
MGIINHPVKLDILAKTYNLKNFVESGTGDGSSMKVAYQTNMFDNLYGIELEKTFYENLLIQFSNLVKFYNGYSKDEMPKVLNDLDDNPTLFWLDAHFPGSDYGGKSYNSEKDESKRIPLQVELEIISKNRNIKNDVFIIDDLRVYKDGPYESGPWKFRESAGAKNCDFIEDLIGETHILVEHHRDQGYMLSYPISTDDDTIRSTVIGEGEY